MVKSAAVSLRKGPKNTLPHFLSSHALKHLRRCWGRLTEDPIHRKGLLTWGATIQYWQLGCSLSLTITHIHTIPCSEVNAVPQANHAAVYPGLKRRVVPLAGVDLPTGASKREESRHSRPRTPFDVCRWPLNAVDETKRRSQIAATATVPGN